MADIFTQSMATAPGRSINEAKPRNRNYHQIRLLENNGTAFVPI